MFKIRLSIVALVASLFAPTTFGRDAQLPPVVASVMSKVGVPASSVSIHVREASTDESLVELNADTPRSPASIMKVLTTFAALDMLGPAYTWKTRAYLGGRLANGVLHGDLFIVGGGDPYMTSERWWSFVQGLRESGLAKITGDIVIDSTAFSPITEDRGSFDAQPFRSYNVLPDALLVNFQTARFTVIANPQRPQPQVLVTPLPSNLVVRNQLRLGTGRCEGYNRGVSFDESAAEPNVVTVSGTFPAACGSYTVSRAIMAAPNYAYGTFRTLWTQSGGALDGAMRIEPVNPSATLFYEFESLPLSEIIRLVNKFSNNVMARHVLLTVGAEKFGTPATVAKGRSAIRSWLVDRGVEIPGLTLENGSGLSRAERITARGLSAVLDIAWHSPFMPELAASLPLSATDGTLRNRFNAPGMQGRIRLKTGRIDNVSALAGFINAASGKTYLLVIMVNHPGAETGSAEAIQIELIRWVFGQ